MTPAEQPSSAGAAAPRPGGRLARFLRRHDPQGTGWRRGVRAALIAPALLGVGLALGSDTLAIYGLFGAVAHLVFGDYDGPRRRRAATYAATTVVGAGLITVATLLSPVVWAAALGTAIVGFALTFLCVLGDAVSKVRSPLLLAFVLAASVSAPPGELGPRLGGWVAAGAVSLAAALYLLPRPVDLAVHDLSVAACRAVADALLEPAAHTRQAAELLDDLARERAARSWRSYGPVGRSRAMVIFVEELETIRDLLRGYSAALAQDPCPEAGRALAAVGAAALRASADAVDGSGPAPDLATIDDARVRHRAVVEAWAQASLAAGTPPSQVLDQLDGVRVLRLVSHVVLTVAAAAVAATKGQVPAVWADTAPRLEVAAPELPTGTVGAVRTMLGTHLSLSSVWFRDSLRVAVALGAGVAVARFGDLENGFWVVLGVISVLRTSVAAAGRSALHALVGTVAGFLVVVPILAVVGGRPPAHWIVLPLAMFVAGYASSALSFAYGQGAFTLFIVLAIDLVEPKGWHAGAVRVEDVFIGCAVALGVGLVFWPHGARREARAALGELYDSLGRLVGVDIDRLMAAAAGSSGVAGSSGATGRLPAPAASDARSEAGALPHEAAAVAAALRRARVAVDDLIAERGDATPGVRASARLLATGAELCLSAERAQAMIVGDGVGDEAAVPASTVASLVTEGEVVTTMLCSVAAAVVRSTPLTIAPADQLRTDRRQATIAALAAWGHDRDRGRRTDALTLVWLGHWLVDLADSAGRLVGPVGVLAAAGGRLPHAPAPAPRPGQPSP